MDFEKIKAAWLAQNFEGYLFDTPLDEIAADIERKAGQMDRMNKRETLKRYMGCIAIYLLCFIMYSNHLTLIGNIGVTLLAIGSTLEFISYLTLHFKFRDVRYDLPYRKFLADERQRILARIKVLKLNTSWNLIPLGLGLVLYVLSFAKTGLELTVLISLVVLAIVATVLQGRRRIRKYLNPYLDEIDADIAEIDTQAA